MGRQATYYANPYPTRQSAAKRYVERYNRTVRYDWLAQNLFSSLDEVQLGATAWLWTYNNERPNMALGGITPRQKLASKYLNNSTAAYC